MDARDICRRLNCSPFTLSEWVDKGCPIDRQPPFAHFDPDRVRKWLEENNIHEWPKESDRDLDEPVRVILNALERREVTPWQAENVMTNLGHVWG